MRADERSSFEVLDDAEERTAVNECSLDGLLQNASESDAAHEVLQFERVVHARRDESLEHAKLSEHIHSLARPPKRRVMILDGLRHSQSKINQWLLGLVVSGECSVAARMSRPHLCEFTHQRVLLT